MTNKEKMEALIQEREREAVRDMQKTCSNVAMIIETTLGYMNPKDKLDLEAYYHLEVAQKILRDMCFPYLKQKEEQNEEAIPFVGIGSDELGESIGETVQCPHCRKPHKVKYGQKINEDGSKTPSKMLGFVKCGKESYLVSINGKKIRGTK
jgi:hypothetical protein